MRSIGSGCPGGLRYREASKRRVLAELKIGGDLTEGQSCGQPARKERRKRRREIPERLGPKARFADLGSKLCIRGSDDGIAKRAPAAAAFDTKRREGDGAVLEPNLKAKTARLFGKLVTNDTESIVKG